LRPKYIARRVAAMNSSIATPAMATRTSAVHSAPSTGATMRMNRKDAPQMAAREMRRIRSALRMTILGW